MSKRLEWTLLFIIDTENQRLLVGEKKRDVCKGYWNGIGGKVNPGETVEQAMVRECQEEANVTPTDFTKRGVIHYDKYIKGEHVFANMHVYIAKSFTGHIKDSDEMRLEWVHRSELKDKVFSPGDEYWLPDVLKGFYVDATLAYDQEGKLLSQKVFKLHTGNEALSQKEIAPAPKPMSVDISNKNLA